MRRRVDGFGSMGYVIAPREDDEFLDNFKLDTIKVIDKNRSVKDQSLGQVSVSTGSESYYGWVVPVVVIVVSAMALMTLYAFLNRR